MKMIIAGVVLVSGVLALGWFFVNKDNKNMEVKPVAMEKKETSTEAMKNGEDDITKEGTMADKTKDEALMKTEVTTSMAPKEAMMTHEVVSGMEKKERAMSVGGYQVYAPSKLSFAKEGKVVLFFRASWCPICRAMDADIRAHLSSIPKDVLILDVDYDNAKDLKTKYGVTSQHTYVKVDAMGNQIAKWSGSETLAELLVEMK